VPFVLDAENYISLAAGVILLVVKIFAFVSCLLFSRASYVAAGKLTKVGWAAILGVGLVVQVVLVRYSPINFLNLAFTIAAFVYLADVRPALAGLRRR
jgi:hypothetical protein